VSDSLKAQEVFSCSEHWGGGLSFDRESGPILILSDPLENSDNVQGDLLVGSSTIDCVGSSLIPRRPAFAAHLVSQPLPDGDVGVGRRNRLR